MFWRRGPVDPGEVLLLQPEEGSVTEPLQQFELVRGASPEDAAFPGLPVDWLHPRALNPDRSLPRPVTCRWLPPPRLRRRPRYDVLLDRDADFPQPMIIPDLPQPEVRVRHLLTDTDYFWRVVVKVDGTIVAESRVGRFRTHAALPRWIRVPHLTNVRDLGGWPVPGSGRVRQGMVYRSSEMNGHLSLSPEGMHVLLHELGLRTDIDLRGSDELPQPALPPEWVRWVNLPVLPYEGIAAPEMREAWQGIFAVLANPQSYPVILHCWAGVDRAASVALLILGALGVSLADAARDYELSSLSIWGERRREGASFRELLYVLGIDAAETRPVRHRVEAFLLGAGVARSDLEAVQSILVEPLPAVPVVAVD
ncbi:MAG: tyrosine-protein phosphatase [Lentisphaeria bacterium]|nr:tyrosine-protein phosphatase [Lentisphaeria bacterium]